MNGYVCKKPLNLGGESYTLGDDIPIGAVAPERAMSLVSSGYIAEVGDNVPVALVASQVPQMQSLIIPIKTDKGTIDLNVNQQSVSELFVLMQKKQDEMIAEVERCSDNNLLIMIHAIDSRKKVKEAAEARGIQLENGSDPVTGVQEPNGADDQDRAEAGDDVWQEDTPMNLGE